MARFSFHFWQFLRTNIFEIFSLTALCISVTGLVYFLDISIHSKIIICIISLIPSCNIAYNMGRLEACNELIEKQDNLTEEQDNLIKELIVHDKK